MNYQKIYDLLIQKRRQFPLNKINGKLGEVVYHHIIPVSCNGNNDPRKEKYNYDGSNLIGLTLREHYVAHKLLAKIYANTEYKYKMETAKNRMTFICKKSKLIHISSRDFAIAKLSQAKNMAQRRKNGTVKTWNKGKRTGLIHVNNGIESILVDPNKIPVGYVKGRLFYKHSKPSWNKGQKHSRVHVNNGIKEMMVLPSSIPEGYVLGRLKKKIS